jgi:chemotaxis protein methyltransferase CheR
MNTPEGGRRAQEEEFEMREDDFAALRALVKTHTGISLGVEKRALVYSRLARRLRALGLKTFRQYREHLETDSAAELGLFRDAITTNLTSFFREPHHFAHLREHVLQPLMTRPDGGRRLRIWSAGCSTGEEPYSIAMTVAETLGDLRRWDVRILATDLDSQVLATASRGCYAESRMGGLSAARRARFFAAGGPEAPADNTIVTSLRDMITFKQLNLMDELPMKGPLDVIFCRNVIIYFDKETQAALLRRMAGKQHSGQLLFLGHSENIARLSGVYSLLGDTVYRRV